MEALKNVCRVVRVIGLFSIICWVIWAYCLGVYVFDNAPNTGDFAPAWMSLNRHLWFSIPDGILIVFTIIYEIVKEEKEIKSSR